MHESDPKEMLQLTRESLDRREFLTVTGGVLASLSAWDGVGKARSQQGQDSSPEGTEVVETPICRLRLDRRNGNLVGVAWKSPSLEVIQEPRLGENFRLLLPRPDCEANYFTSSEQEVSRIEKTAEGVACMYESLRNARETLAGGAYMPPFGMYAIMVSGVPFPRNQCILAQLPRGRIHHKMMYARPVEK